MATFNQIVAEPAAVRRSEVPPAGEPRLDPASNLPPEDPGSQALAEALQSSFRVIRWIMLGLIVLFFASGLFTVQPNEVALKLRFGKPVGIGAARILKPGFHWSFPYPIDEVIKIPVGQSQSAVSTAGWYATSPELEARNELPPPRESLIPGADGYTLTGDGNIMHVRAILRYRIDSQDPAAHLFNFVQVRDILTNILNNALFHASARFSADAALYKEKEAFREKVLDRVRQRIEEYHLGITVDSSSEVLTSAPLTIRQAFEQVQLAENTSYKTVSDASSQAETVRRTASGEASVIIGQGMVRSNQIVTTVAAEAQKFSDLLTNYLSNPVFFKNRMLVETVQRVLTNAQDKYYVPARPDGKPWELRLQLNREPEAPPPVATP